MTPETQLKPQEEPDVDLSDAIEQLRIKKGVPKALMDRLVHQESGGRESAVSPKKARGSFQVMPSTFDLYNKKVGGVLDFNSPLDRAYVGLSLLQDNYKQFKNYAKNDQHNWGMALAAYHSNPRAVMRDLRQGGIGIPDTNDGLINTRDYVYNIMSNVGDLKASQQPEAPAVETPQQEVLKTPQVTSGVAAAEFKGATPQEPIADLQAPPLPAAKPIAFEPASRLGVHPTTDPTRALSGPADLAMRRLVDQPAPESMEAGFAEQRYEAPASVKLGKAVKVPFSPHLNPTQDDVVKGYLSALGPEYAKYGEKYKAETGNDILSLNAGDVDRDQEGNFYVQPSEGAIRILNAYVGSRGNLDAAKAEAAKVAGERRQSTENAQAGAKQDIAEVQAGRIGLGTLPAVQRTVESPVIAYGGAKLAQLGGLISGFGIVPNSASKYLQLRGKIMEQGASAPPLTPAGEVMQRSVPEKVATGLTHLGLGVADILLLKKGTGLSTGQVMALESLAHDTDLPIGQRSVNAAQAYALGKILDSHMSRSMSGAIFGVPTAVEGAQQVARGDKSKTDVLIDTLVQGGTGALLAGGKAERPLELDIERAPISGVQGRGALDVEAQLAEREQRVQPTFLRDDAGNPVARVLNPDEVVAGGKMKVRPIHHSDTEARDAAGRFTEGGAREPQGRAPETSGVAEPSNVQPEAQRDVRTADTRAVEQTAQGVPPQAQEAEVQAAIADSLARKNARVAEGEQVERRGPDRLSDEEYQAAIADSLRRKNERVAAEAATKPSGPASEDLVGQAQSPSGPETHPTVRRFLSSEYKDKILAAIGSDAKPLNPTELGGIKASSVSFEKPDGSIVTVEDAFVSGNPTYGSKRDGFTITKTEPTRTFEATGLKGSQPAAEPETTPQAASEPQVAPTTKQPWQMTKEEERAAGLPLYERFRSAQQALNEGVLTTSSPEWPRIQEDAIKSGYGFKTPAWQEQRSVFQSNGYATDVDRTLKNMGLAKKDREAIVEKYAPRQGSIAREIYGSGGVKINKPTLRYSRTDTSKILDEGHQLAVRQAVEKGKPVPPKVLADYPELQSAAKVAPAENLPSRAAAPPETTAPHPAETDVVRLQRQYDAAQVRLKEARAAARQESGNIGPAHQVLEMANKTVRGLAMQLSAAKKKAGRTVETPAALESTVPATETRTFEGEQYTRGADGKWRDKNGSAMGGRVKEALNEIAEGRQPPERGAPEPSDIESQIQARIKAEIPEHAPDFVKRQKEFLIRRELEPVESKPMGKEAGAVKLPEEEFARLVSKGWDFYDQKIKPTFDEWSRKMREVFGKDADPHLRNVWRQLQLSEESATTAKHAATAIEREELGLPEYERAKGRSADSLLEAARAENAKNPRGVDVLIDQGINGRKNYTDTETMRVNLRAQEIKNRIRELDREIAETTDPEVIADKAAEQDALINEQVRTIEARERAGTEWGKAGVARQRTVGEDFELAPMIARMKKATKKDLTPELRKQVEDAHKRIAELEDQYAASLAKKGIQRIAREARRERRQVTRKVLDEEAATIKQNIAAEFARIRTQQSVQPSGLAGLDPEGAIAKLALKYAKNRFDAGLTDAAQLVDDVHGVLSEFTDLTKRQVAEMISGYKLPQASETKETLERTFNDLRKEKRAALRQADIDAGVITAKTAGPRIPKEGPRQTKKAIQSRYDKQLREIERRIREQDFGPRPKRGQTVLDPETRKLQVDVERAKLDFQRMVRKQQDEQRTPAEKVADLLVNWGRAAKLSYTSTLGKLTGAATGRVVMSPIENLIGEIPHRLAPKLSKMAPTEGGGFNKAAEVAALWKSGRFRQVLDQLTKGGSDLDVLFGSEGKLIDKEMHGQGYLGIPGRVHGALKEYPRQAEFDRARLKVLKAYERDGKDVTRPDVQLAANMEAFNAAERARFQQRNFISDGFNDLMRKWEAKGGAAKGAAKVGRFLFPITRVPVNVVGETLNYTLGLPRAVAEHAWRTMTGSINKLTPEQADSIMRSYKKGGVGLAMMVYAYLHPEQFGGYYQPHEKRGEKEPHPGEIMFFGRRIPKTLTHIPILEAAQLAATTRRVMDKLMEKGESKSEATLGGAKAAGLGLAKQIPFYETPHRFMEGVEGTGEFASRWLGQQAKGMIPGFIQESARAADENEQGEPIKRKRTGFVQEIQEGVPLLRQRLPESPTERLNFRDRLLEQKRSGATPDLDSLVESGKITEADRKKIEKQSGMTDFQVGFENAPNDKALDRYERLIKTNDPRAREVEDQMAKKAWSLTHSDALTQAQKDEFQRRLDALGIVPRNPQKRSGSSPFSRRLGIGVSP